MKSVFDASTRQELINRINSLTHKSTAQWGKMNIFQMLRHGSLSEDMMQGRLKVKRVFIGRLIGGMLLKKVLKGDTPFAKNSPTSSLLHTTHETGDIEQQKKDWIKRIEQYANFTNHGFVHPFFGPMTDDQVGRFVYKHIDHHLRQFSA